MANRVSYIIQLQDKFSAAAKKIQRANEGIERGLDKVNRKLATQSLRFKNLGKSLGKMGIAVTALATVPIALLGRSMIKAGSDAQETANKFNAVFDDVNKKANNVSDSFAQSFGLASSTAQELIGNTGDLLVGFGFTGDAALDVSKRVNELAADLTSFQNVEGGVKAASAALTKALLGETESAKSLGIVIRQNTKEFRDSVAATARARQITEQQAKALVILDMAARQSRKAIGDVSRTWEDYASVARRAEEQNKEMRESFGVILLPIATKAMKVFNGLARSISALSPLTKKIILGIAAFVAIGGPLLLILGAMAFSFSAILAIMPALVVGMGFVAGAFGLITLPILAVIAAVIAAVAAFLWLRDNWIMVSDIIGGTIEQIGINFSLMWQGVKDSFMSVVSFIGAKIDLIMAPIRAAKSFIGLGRSASPIRAAKSFIGLGRSASPGSVPGASNGTIDASITVAAEKGSKVSNTKAKSAGSGLNVGVNMVTAS